MVVSRKSPVRSRWSLIAGVTLLALAFTLPASPQSGSSTPIPELTAPVNDFAKVIDGDSAREMDRMIRSLQTATGDVVVVATVPTIEGYGDIREYIVKMFANHGKGIGQKGKNNGLLILLAMKERRVQIEVGYDLEQWVTDGFAGETSREVMTPLFRSGRYGEGLRAGTERVIGRIAQGRGVSLEGVRAPRETRRRRGSVPGWIPIVVFLVILIVSRLGGTGGRSSGFRRGGWSSGVGPFGGGFGGGFGGFGGGGGGGGGFGGGFGGFGGGSSGGGGGGSSW